MSHNTHLPYTIQTILSDIYEYDSQVCTSEAGRRAVENLIDSICGYLERKYNVQETFGISVIEAMCAGLPVIASDWSGYRESMRHGETGFLVPVYWADGVDLVSRSAILAEPMETHRQLAQTVCMDLQKLTDYITLLSNDASLRRSMGAAARKRAVSYYDWPVAVRAYEELWDDMILKGRCSPAHEESAHGVCTYDYLDVFKHFATGIVTRDSNLTLGAMGRDFSREFLIFKC